MWDMKLVSMLKFILGAGGVKAKIHLHLKMTFFRDERKNGGVYAKKCHFLMILEN